MPRMSKRSKWLDRPTDRPVTRDKIWLSLQDLYIGVTLYSTDDDKSSLMMNAAKLLCAEVVQN